MPPPDLLFITVDLLHPDPHNPREDETPDDELVASIREFGVLQSLLVRSDPDGGYLIIGGHRRWRGAMEATVPAVPVMVVDGWDEERIAAAQLVENMHRVALNPIEQAKGLDRLRQKMKLTQRAIAAATGLHEVKVSNLLRLLLLPKKVQIKVALGELAVHRALGYDRPTSHHGAGGVLKGDKDYQAIAEGTRALGAAIRKRDTEAQSTTANAMLHTLKRWTTVDENAEGPTTRCPYCTTHVPVPAPADASARIHALSAHMAAQPKCKSRHAKAMRQATR